MEDIFFRYLHFLGLIGLSSALICEHLLLKKEMQPNEIKRLAVIDIIYGLSALFMLGAGLLLWFGGSKPSAFYTQNGLFHIKLTLFVIMAGLSVYPTIFFLRKRKSDSAVLIPKTVYMIIRTELLLLAVIPLLAVFMAAGYNLH